MNTFYFLRAFYTNAVIAGVFTFVFLSALTQAYAQPINPVGNGEVGSVNTVSSKPITVITYEPSFYARTNSVSVTFKGFISVPIYTTSQVWFEWGETSALGQKTSSQTVNISFSLQETLNDLKPNTTYYYRTVGQNVQQGIVYGSIVSVRTPNLLSNQTAFTGTTQTNTSVNTNSNGNTNNLLGWPFGIGSNNTKETGTSTATVAEENSSANKTESAVSKNTAGGFFPTTLLGWILLTLFVFIIVGLTLYLVDLYQELKQRQEEERKRVANGNGNGNHYGAPA